MEQDKYEAASSSSSSPSSSSNSATTMSEEAEASPPVKKMVKLRTSDLKIVEVEARIVKEMKVVQSVIEGETTDASGVIPLLNVDSKNLNLIVELKSKNFDREFAKILSHNELKELILAANYLEMTKAVQYLAQAIAEIIQDKTPEFVREFFGIVNDFSPKEEARLRSANAWAFADIEDDGNDS